MSRTLIKFYASWCMPCKAMSPVVDKLASSFDIPLVEIDIDDVPEAAAEWGVGSVPTVLLIDGDTEVGRVVGAMPISRIVNELGLDE